MLRERGGVALPSAVNLGLSVSVFCRGRIGHASTLGDGECLNASAEVGAAGYIAHPHPHRPPVKPGCNPPHAEEDCFFECADWPPHFGLKIDLQGIDHVGKYRRLFRITIRRAHISYVVSFHLINKGVDDHDSVRFLKGNLFAWMARQVH